MSEDNKIQKFAETAYKHHLTQACLVVIDSVPIIGTGLAAGRKAAEQRYINILEQRKTIWFSELEKGGHITQEMYESEEFIHSVVVLYDAIIRTYNHDKIRRFARILLSAIKKDELASDKFEEYAKILESLSEREINLLSSLQKLEHRFKYTKKISISKSPHSSSNAIQEWVFDITMNVWDEFIDHIMHKYQLPKPLLMNELSKLEGMGLYSGTQAIRQEGINFNNIGTTSFLFDDFSEWIKLENEKLNADG
jgi:hypothetical protein